MDEVISPLSPLRYEDLLTAYDDRKHQLDRALSQAEEFDEMYNKLMEWLEEVEKKQGNMEPIHSDLDAVQQQLEDNKVCVCTRACVSVCLCVSFFCVLACFMHVYALTYVRMYLQLHTYVHTYVADLNYVCTYVCMSRTYVRTCTCTYACIHTCTHTQFCTH